MKKLALYEPALCCSSGVCGPSVDDNLLRITGLMKEIKDREGVMMIRYNLSSTPDAFVRNEEVTKVLHEEGAKALPITLLDGEIVKIGAYPTNEEISEYLGIQLVKEAIQ